jgi:hypothetical protein
MLLLAYKYLIKMEVTVNDNTPTTELFTAVNIFMIPASCSSLAKVFMLAK